MEKSLTSGAQEAREGYLCKHPSEWEVLLLVDHIHMREVLLLHRLEDQLVEGGFWNIQALCQDTGAVCLFVRASVSAGRQEGDLVLVWLFWFDADAPSGCRACSPHEGPRAGCWQSSLAGELSPG